MGATAFNRARRLAAERSGKPFEELSYEAAVEILRQPELLETDSQLEAEATSQLTRDERFAALKAANWEDLRDLLKSYELPMNKPKNLSWDDFAIPQILQHEGF